ncbi:MAG: PIN domain-containing protein [Candidatus Cloacimonetes bacterium]|nr:PIN domain-containing protein [Candidatus Cloacimonadota bacterium]
MIVLLDTNIIVADFRLNSPNFAFLFESIEKGLIDVYIPAIVFDEILNKYRQRLNNAHSKLSSEIETYNKITGKSLNLIFNKADIDEEVRLYNKYLNNIIKELKIVKLPYPDTEHKRLANKAMRKIKPFNSNGKGVSLI